MSPLHHLAAAGEICVRRLLRLTKRVPPHAVVAQGPLADLWLEFARHYGLLWTATNFQTLRLSQALAPLPALAVPVATATAAVTRRSSTVYATAPAFSSLGPLTLKRNTYKSGVLGGEQRKDATTLVHRGVGSREVRLAQRRSGGRSSGGRWADTAATCESLSFLRVHARLLARLPLYALHNATKRVACALTP